MYSSLLRIALAPLLIGLAACGGDGTGPDENGGNGGNGGPSGSQVDTVLISGVTFQPSSLNIRPGGTVVWVNTQSIFHTVTPDGHTRWQRATTNTPGEALRVTFPAAGTFDYLCEPHQSVGMTGRIVVAAAP